MIILYLLFLAVIFLIYRKSKNGDLTKIFESVFVKTKINEKLKRLNPTSSIDEVRNHYYMNKLSLILKTAAIGTIIAIFISLSVILASEVKDGEYILRNPLNGMGKEINLKAVMDGEIIFPFKVLPKQYSDKELEDMWEEFINKLDDIVLGENLSVDKVNSSMNLVTKIREYPFSLDWESSNYSLIDSSGSLGAKEAPVEGEIVKLTAVATCGTWRREYIFAINLFPPDLTEDMKKERLVLEAISKNDAESKYDDRLPLPKEINGQLIEWQEKKTDNGIIFFAMTIIASVLIYVGKDRDLSNRFSKRSEQLLLDYPEFINKLILFMSAGMTVRMAFKKMAADYIRKQVKYSDRRFVYEEMILASNELDSGIAEEKVYENFSIRCGISRYFKISAVLTQNLKKGGGGILSIFKEESREAFEERKSIARRLGEEAGTKLLAPMMIMLLIVMAVIMLPAFLSFSF